nr:hypothetical protein GCM10025730_41000 [Promicromonospora thailandica]
MSATNAQPAPVTIGDLQVGADQPVYVIGEIGINHNGDVEIAKKLIDVAVEAGCQAVKFQKRTPEISTPKDQRDKIRQTPWGEMTYLEYKYKVEFEEPEYTEIDAYAKEKGIQWFASPWDAPSVEFLEKMNVPTHKVASASVTDHEMLRALAETGKPIILSTGMSTLEQIDAAVEILDSSKLVILHATSTYPLPPRRRTCAPSRRCRSATACPSATRATRPASRSPSRPWRWALSPSSGTSRSTVPCGARTTPPRSSPRASRTWCATSASSRRRSVTARSASCPVSSRRCRACVASTPDR